jgi:hypothetical protein
MSNSVEYYYLIMSQIFVLKNEVVEEILRERAYNYLLNKKPLDFWLVISPKFIFSKKINYKIKQSNFYDKNKNFILGSNFFDNDKFEFYASLVTTDKEFYNWFSLRMGSFEKIEEIPNKQNTGYKFDGICGKLEIGEINDSEDLLSRPKNLHPLIATERYKKSLELFFNEQFKNLR